MFTRRDFVVALLSITMTIGVVAFAQSQKSVMGSSVFDWNTIEAKPTKVGAMRKFFQAPTATLDELECHATTINAGEIPHGPHQHPDEEIIIVKEGTLEMLTNGELKRVGPGSVIFAASNQLHGIKNVGTTAATYYIFRWKSPGMFKQKES